MHTPTVRLLENIHPVAGERFLEAGWGDVKILPKALSGTELHQILSETEVLGIRSKTNLHTSDFEATEKLIAVGCFCIGTDQVDLRAAKSRGIPVFNAPYSNTRSVAELVMAEIVCLARHVGDLNNKAHQGIWQKTAQGSYEVRGKVLGIIGYGHIGSQLSVLAEAFGMRVIYYDIQKKLPLGNATPVASLKDILAKSDFVTLHVPDTEETRLMISKEEIARMKDGAFLLNLSRGKVVDLDALAEGIKSKKLAGAAVDVYPEEPESNGEGFKSVLQGLENVILTPHIGGSTEEAQEAIGREVSDALLKYYFVGTTTGAVNFPQLELPRLKSDGLRVLNIHKNVPGVLGEINSIVSGRGVNISAQYLATDSDIGYLAMDVETKDPLDLTKEIDALKTSLRTRLLRPVGT
jgi:D-3-phosphoglycerate dehydrogenase